MSMCFWISFCASALQAYLSNAIRMDHVQCVLSPSVRPAGCGNKRILLLKERHPRGRGKGGSKKARERERARARRREKERDGEGKEGERERRRGEGEKEEKEREHDDGACREEDKQCSLQAQHGLKARWI